MRWLAIMLAIAACPGPRPARREPPLPDTPPTLTIESPDRGTFVTGAELVVTGRVSDDGTVRVTVNGGDAAVAPDGTFTATLAIAPGLTLIEIHAIDTTQHDVRDVRAVLAGPFASSDGSTRAPMGVRLGRRGLSALGKALAVSARAIDFTAAAQALNPVYDNRGCLGATVDIASVSVGRIDVDLVPKRDALDATVTINDIEVRLNVRYEVACIGGTTSMTVRTRARVRADLGAALRDREIRTSFATPTVAFDDFRIDIGGVPGPIAKLVRGTVRASIERALTKAIETKVPPLANARLAELLAGPPRPSLLGRDLTIDILPRRLELAATGLYVAADTALAVVDGHGGRYVTTTSIDPAASDPPDLRIWIAADTLNQVLAGLWAAGAFDRTIARDAVGPLALLLDAKVHTIQIALSLPPTVSANKQLELAIGDLIVTARDASGADIQRFAVSLRSTLAVKPGEVALATTAPTVHAQLLAQAIATPLDGAAVEGIVTGAWALVATLLDDALARIPIPGLTGVTLEIRTLTFANGTIVLDVAASQ